MDWSLTLRGVERLFIVLAGMLCMYLGYLLFVKGVSGKASLKADFNKSKLQLANAAPGIFFALFGATILVFITRQAVKLDASIPTTTEAAHIRGEFALTDAERARRVNDSLQPCYPDDKTTLEYSNHENYLGRSSPTPRVTPR
jgi:hypothetical protein